MSQYRRCGDAAGGEGLVRAEDESLALRRLIKMVNGNDRNLRTFCGSKIAYASDMQTRLRALLFAATLFTAVDASAVPYYYVDWTAADISAGTAAGTITLPDASTVTVGF